MPGRRGILLTILVAALGTAGFGDERSVEVNRNIPQHLLERSVERRAAAVRLVSGGRLPASGIDRDGRRFSVQHIAGGMPQYYIEHNDTARVTTRTDLIQLDGEYGTGMVLGIWDGGAVRTTHQEFGGRVTWADTAVYDEADHATHVAGTMIASGIDTRALGMAPQAGLNSYDWDSDIAEVIGEASSGMLLSNHSYALIRGWFTNFYIYWFGDTTVSGWEDYRFGFYCDESRVFDSLLCEYPDYLLVCSAGNERTDDHPFETWGHYIWNEAAGEWQPSSTPREEPDGGVDGFDCISNGMNLAKNVLTVAAVRDVLAYTGPADVVMTEFSSWGPTDDGRIKPDISGDGKWVFSSIASDDAAYGTGSGTSMASPNVCGSLALVQNRYIALKGAPMHAATLKALAIHTAREAGPGPGPDYMFGWGLLDAYGAFEVVEENWFNNWLGRIEELTLAQDGTIEFSYRCDGTEDELRLTICWSDPPGTPALPALNPPDIMLVNDLDLRVSKDASTWMPWRLDPAAPAAAAATADNFRDNVEQIVIDSPAAGDYIVTIGHKSMLAGGSQNFSLIATGGVRRRTWHIYADGSGDAPDITTAVSLAGDYDSIFVHPGTYHEHDINLNKWLYLVGTDGAETTFLDAGGLGRCLYIPAGSDSVIISGLTMTGGVIGGAWPYGGGMSCANSSVRISGCIFEDNEAEDGGGIFLYEASPLIEDCVVTGNSASYRGGGIWGLSTSFVIERCLVAHNTAANDGGGLYLMGGTSAPSVGSCTFSHNEAGAYGSGIYLANGSGVTLTNTIVSFGYVTAGIHGHPYAAGVTMSCCDVYGNAGGDYGGSIPDQTGSNDNISVDPLYCDAAAGDFEIFDLSPCRSAASPCGTLIGWGGIGCAAVPDLVITEFTISDSDLVAGETTSATVIVKNVGMLASDPFMIDYYDDRSAAPSPGTTGTLRYSAPGLAVGDSVIQVIYPITSDCYGEWRSWVRADTEDEVNELDEGNNVYGPRVIYWRIPQHAGWPVTSSDAVTGCPAIAALDDDPGDSEVIAGDVSGMLHVWRSDGTYVPGWPVSIGDSLVSSPAVGNITGDYHAEVVIGATDGTLYAFDRAGTQLWSRNIVAPVYQTPALADLDDDGLLEVIIAVHGYKTGGTVHVLDGTTGMPWSGSWPVTLTAPRLSSPAVGDVDDDGQYEIAVCGYGLNSPVRSHIYLLRENGASFSGAWPVTIDTVVVAAPVLGDIAAAPGGPLEIVTGGINGEIFAVSTTGVIWPSPPRVPGTIERSLSLMQYDLDAYQEIICASSYYSEPVPPFGSWIGAVTVVDNTGSVMAGWPNGAGSSASRRVMPSAAAITGTVFVGSPYGGGSLYAWSTKSADYREGFPNPAANWITSGTAVGDVDGDGQIDIVAATSDDRVNCYDLSCSGAYPASRRLDWPMYRCGPARTGCYYPPVITGDEEPETVIPAVTMIQSIHPNPFNPATRIVFDLRERGRARVAVYDAAGRAVALLADRSFDAGRHELMWDGSTGVGAPAASGVYFCRLETGGTVDVRKMVLMR